MKKYFVIYRNWRLLCVYLLISPEIVRKSTQCVRGTAYLSLSL